MTDYFSGHVLRKLVVFTLLVGGTAAFAQDDAQQLEQAWQEIALQLPAAPLQENLLPFYVSPTATQSFAIDRTSISIGKDGVVRYTLVSVSAGGAKNISFEGIRCELLQKRLYAFGRSDGSWSRSRREGWEPISAGSPNKQHATLVNDFLCKDKMVAGTVTQMVEKFRSDGGLSTRKGMSPLSD